MNISNKGMKIGPCGILKSHTCYLLSTKVGQGLCLLKDPEGGEKKLHYFVTKYNPDISYRMKRDCELSMVQPRFIYTENKVTECFCMPHTPICIKLLHPALVKVAGVQKGYALPNFFQLPHSFLSNLTVMQLANQRYRNLWYIYLFLLLFSRFGKFNFFLT